MACTSTSSVARSDSNGFTNCENPSDCCLCSSIQCKPNCDRFVAGDHSAFGVKDVVVSGSLADGATIDCRGDHACANTYMVTTNIVQIICSGRYSCQNAQIMVSNPIDGFYLNCGVTAACFGMQISLDLPYKGNCGRAGSKEIHIKNIECVGVGGCDNMLFTINNNGCDRVIIDNIECRTGSCEGASFNFVGSGPVTQIRQCVLPATGGAPLGLHGCAESLQGIKCLEDGSCSNQIMGVVDPQDGFELLCEGAESCSNAMLTVDVTQSMKAIPVKNLVIKCIEMQSCLNANMAVRNYNGMNEVVDVEIICSKYGACDGATFHGGLGVTFMKIGCGEPANCNGCTYNGIPCY